MAKDDDKLIQEAKKRFQRCEDHESDTRPLWKEDLRFANADPDNGFQWPTDLRKSREGDKRPCLTINKVKQHNRQITNEARQNKPSIRVQPVDSGADKKTAEILNGIIRHIESNSSADTAYDTAAEFAVDAGIGYWRVVTDYAADDSFDQEIFIKRVKNPLNVYLDPDIQEADGSDARFGFVFEDMPKEEFAANYPNADPVSWDNSTDAWQTKETIRVAEYFKVEEVKDTLVADADGNTKLLSELEPEIAEVVNEQLKAKAIRSRPVTKRQVMWYLLAGDQCIEKKEWPGKYIPIVRVVGEEVEIDGKVDRKGHTRQMKDAQRMYNYNSTASVEYGALQTKVPWVAPAEATEGYEEYWDNANTHNFSRLPYNAFTEDGTAIPAPQRPLPPAPAMLYIEGMRIASEELKMSSGQYDASMGAKSNETSGRAIMARQREGDVATFHFVDNVARAIKYTGKILIDLIPKIYDTERVVRILGEDGKEDKATIKPDMAQAYAKQQKPNGEIEEIYNPTIGRYDVTVAVGPSYSTRRQEAFYALTDMASRDPSLMQKAGDIVMKAADFPMADQLADRLKKTLPPGLADEEGGEAPEVAALKQQLQQAQAQMQALGAEHQQMAADKDIELQKLTIERYKAETDRLKLIYPTMPAPLAQELAADMGLQAANTPDIYPGEGMPPDPNMMQQQEPASAGFFTPEESQQ